MPLTPLSSNDSRLRNSYTPVYLSVRDRFRGFHRALQRTNCVFPLVLPPLAFQAHVPTQQRNQPTIPVSWRLYSLIRENIRPAHSAERLLESRVYVTCMHPASRAFGTQLSYCPFVGCIQDRYPQTPNLSISISIFSFKTSRQPPLPIVWRRFYLFCRSAFFNSYSCACSYDTCTGVNEQYRSQTGW